MAIVFQTVPSGQQLMEKVPGSQKKIFMHWKRAKVSPPVNWCKANFHHVERRL